jgi:hypothetical protein
LRDGNIEVKLLLLLLLLLLLFFIIEYLRQNSTAVAMEKVIPWQQEW